MENLCYFRVDAYAINMVLHSIIMTFMGVSIGYLFMNYVFGEIMFQRPKELGDVGNLAQTPEQKIHLNFCPNFQPERYEFLRAIFEDFSDTLVNY